MWQKNKTCGYNILRSDRISCHFNKKKQKQKKNGVKILDSKVDLFPDWISIYLIRSRLKQKKKRERKKYLQIIFFVH